MIMLYSKAPVCTFLVQSYCIRSLLVCIIISDTISQYVPNCYLTYSTYVCTYVLALTYVRIKQLFMNINAKMHFSKD